MSKNLVIVESPAKAKTIEKFLGSEYKVVSSNGHIADLPSNELGIDLENNYNPKYKITNDKKDLVKKLKNELKNVDTVWLASDEDREGEAIAWHLSENLNLNESNTKRIDFREITKTPICFTLDAGPNLHLLYPENFSSKVLDFINSELINHCKNGKFILDKVGEGAKKI